MGSGDDIMGTGMARGFHERGKLAAFGDGKRIIWGPWSEDMFRHNPNIAAPGAECSANLEWVPYYKGSRIYNSLKNGKWVWNYAFKATPGEFFFSKDESGLGETFNKINFVVMEPNVPWQKEVALNKDWGGDKYAIVADKLKSLGYEIIQFIHKNSKNKLQAARKLEFQRFRDAISVLSKSSLYIGPEGGMHHAAAAVGIPGVVIFGGFIPPAVTGYDGHINLTGGADACGNIKPCGHCSTALRKISTEQVVNEALQIL
jgi:Glycosyltransferase family 9 (heptosyltransferase)